jgi:hypothetical protein
MKLCRIAARIREFDAKFDSQIKVAQRANSPELSEHITRCSATLGDLASLSDARYDTRVFREAEPTAPRIRAHKRWKRFSVTFLGVEIAMRTFSDRQNHAWRD